MKALTKASAGFTLIEVLMYVALFGVLIGGTALLAYQFSGSALHTSGSTTAGQEGLFVSAKLERAVAKARSAQAVGGALVLDSGDVVFTESGGRVMVSRGASFVPLTSSAVTAKDMDVVVLPATGGARASVRVTFSLNDLPFVFFAYLKN